MGINVSSPGVTDIGEGFIYIPLAMMPYTVVAGTWTTLFNANYWQGNSLYNSSTAQNDEVTIQVYLAAGTYSANLLTYTANDRGILTAKLDGSAWTTFDTYSAGPVNATTVSKTGLAVATSGLKTLSLSIPTKNGASSAYTITSTALVLTRTA